MNTEIKPLSELDAMIQQGWGDYPRTKIPPNWREVAGPCPIRGFDARFAPRDYKPRKRKRNGRDALYNREWRKKNRLRCLEYNRRWMKKWRMRESLAKKQIGANLFESECVQPNLFSAQA